MFSSQGLTAFTLTSVLLSVGHFATAQPAGPADPLVLAAQDTCSAAKRREQELNAEVSQQPNKPIVSAKSAFRGDPAQLIYFCKANDRIVRRHIFMRFADATIAEAALNRQVSALTEELGHPCAAIVQPPADSTNDSSNDTLGLRRTVVWNINTDYKAIVFFFLQHPPILGRSNSYSTHWRTPVVGKIPGHLARSRMSLPNPKQSDSKSGAPTLIIP